MLRRVLLLLASLVLAGAGTIGATAAQAAPVNATADQAISGQMVDRSPCPYRGGHQTLRQGSQGAAVKHLQCLLNKVWGYGTKIDGIFGPKTRSAVVAHQKDCHITRDGVVGPVTWKRLHLDSTTRECRDRGRN